MLLLNLGVIAHELKTKPDVVCGNIYYEMGLQDIRLMPLSAGQHNDTAHLYIAQWDQIPADAELPPYMICVGGGEEAGRFFNAQGVSCLIFHASVNLALLMSEIQDIFDTYHNYDYEYRMLLYTQKPMHMILEFCMSFLGNYAFLLDPKYAVLESGMFSAPEMEDRFGFDKAQMTELMNRIADKIKEISLDTSEAGDLLIEHVEESTDIPEFFFCRFFDGSLCIATLVICRTTTPFYPFSPSLLQYFANLLQPCMAGRYSSSVKTTSYIRKVIDALIQNRGCNLTALAENLAILGWDMRDMYQLIYIRTGVSERRHYKFPTDYYLYENIFPDCIAVNSPAFACSLLVLHNPTEELLSKHLNSLRELTTKNKVECRISLPFNNFLHMKDHFDLVRTSLLTMGDQREYVSMYRDVMVKHIISVIGSSFPLLALCHCAAIRLDEYDRQNGTELLVTLEKYLANNRSVQKAGDELFIHRNTINYRLKKIEEISGISLDFSSDHLHLLVSCIVLRTLREMNPAGTSKTPSQQSPR